jgi:hypothetical protein
MASRVSLHAHVQWWLEDCGRQQVLLQGLAGTKPVLDTKEIIIRCVYFVSCTAYAEEVIRLPHNKPEAGPVFEGTRNMFAATVSINY